MNLDPRKHVEFADLIEDYKIDKFMEKKYDATHGGIVIAVLGVVLGSVFSQSCAQEVIGKLLPVLGALPGIITAWIARRRIGGTTKFGFVRPPKI